MKIRENKGITIISLIVTVVILLIISSVVITEMNTGDKFRDYQYMKADIEVIKNSALVYYNKYGTIPTTDEIDFNGQEDTFYKIDLEKLGNMTLNYGKGNDTEDVYIINKDSYEIYYLKGIKDEEGVLKHQ